MAAVTRLLGPVVTLVQATLVGPLTQLISPHRSGADLTTDELAALLDLSAKRGILGHDANELIQEIFDLSQVRVGELMVPRVDIVAYDIDADPEGLARLFRQTHLHKIPVYEGDIDHILGVVPARRLLLEPERPLRELTSEVVFVPEAATAERTLLQLRLRRRQIAIVVDEYGGTAGLITMEDVMEQIVGDIRDVHEQEPEAPVVRLSEREYLLDGDLAIHEWSEAFGTGLAPARVSTVGGLVASLLGRIPRNGDKVQYRNLLFGVESMRRRRVGKLRLELLEGER
jgi:putative hemolysin